MRLWYKYAFNYSSVILIKFILRILRMIYNLERISITLEMIIFIDFRFLLNYDPFIFTRNFL